MVAGSVVGIDHGEKRTGFAVTDALRVSIEPLGTFHGPGDSDELLDHVAELAHDRTVAAFVVGYPYNMDGTEGSRARDVAAFIERLEVRFPEIPVVRQDERLTTKEAEERLRDAGHHGSARKSRRDSWSAVVLLEDWIGAGEQCE